ncbi:MAG: hypothetical protein K8R92_00220 [Planctomycetes bacterium]|nr:hypothetical protein [Planctomycetota bacterium]
MAKIFYTIDEACAKLGKSNDQVMELIKNGKLREFRDRGQLMLKVEDVNSLSTDAASDSGLDLKLDSGTANLGGGSDSFELDLSDSASPALAADPKGDSPVGLSAPAGIKDDNDDLMLELEPDAAPTAKSPAAKTPAAPAKSKSDSDDLLLELDLDASNASAAPAASASASAAKSAAAKSAAFDDDSLTLELDLSDSAPAAPAAPGKTKSGGKSQADSEALFLEDSLASGIAASPAKSATGGQTTDFDQTIEDARDGSALGLDSRVDSAIGASGSLEADKINLDQPGSGSGLLDLTQESEDSQMGAALMDEAFQGDDEEAPKNASGIFGGASGESGINDAAIVNSGTIAAAAPAFAGAAAVGVEVYSGSWSGLTVGLLVPAIVGLTATAAMLVVKGLGGTPELAVMFASDWMVWTGGYAGAIAICGGIGFFVGKATE